MLVVGCGGIAENDIALLTQAIAFFGPRLAMVLYSVLDQAVMAACARAGVAGYLPKASSPDALAAAVSLVQAGGECYPQPAGRPLPRTAAPALELRELTQRQAEILQLLVQGKTMREIGEQVGISVATVKSHARTLYWKLNARNQAEAAYVAVQLGLVSGVACRRRRANLRVIGRTPSGVAGARGLCPARDGKGRQFALGRAQHRVHVQMSQGMAPRGWPSAALAAPFCARLSTASAMAAASSGESTGRSA